MQHSQNPGRRLASSRWNPLGGIAGTLASALWFVAGCGPPTASARPSLPEPRAQQAAAPDWYPGGDAQRYPRERFLVGVGSCGKEVPLGTRAACAVQSGRERIALDVEAKVIASVERSKTVTSSDSQAGSEASVRATVVSGGKAESSVVLEGSRAAEEACAGDACYALVVVEREAFRRTLKEKNATATHRLESLLSSAKPEDIVQSLYLFNKADALATTIDERSAIVAAVGAVGESSPSARLVVAAARQKAVERCPVCLESALSSVAPERLFTALRQSLGLLGFREVSLGSPPGCQYAELTVSFNGSMARRETTEVGGMRLEVTEIQGSLSLSQHGRALGASQSVKARGVSKDPEQSANEALERLNEAVDAAFADLVGTTDVTHD